MQKNLHPFLNQPFEIHWSQLQPDFIEADIKKGISDAKVAIDFITNQKMETLTYQSTLEALENSTKKLSEAWGFVGHLDSVCNNDALREVYNKILPEVSNFFTSIGLNEALWKIIDSFSKTKEADTLSKIQKRHLEETLYSFEKSGAHLNSKDKIEFESINQELSQCTQKYSERVLDSTNAWDYVTGDEEEISGLPEILKEAARQDALTKNYGDEKNFKWRFSLQMPSLVPALTYLESSKLRKKIWEASSQIGFYGEYDNTDLIWKILKLRQRKAEILGRKNFADLATERRMAATGKCALEFVENLFEKVQGSFIHETDTLEKFSASTLAQSQENLEPWDVAYWSEKQRKELFDYDEEELRPYFPIESVISGMFDLAEKLFGVSIIERPTSFEGEPCSITQELSGEHAEVWHPEVRFYEMRDGDKHLGSFYADWHPRESKRGGAWMNSLITGGPEEEKHMPNLGLITGNLTAPTPEKPALLNHREVETVFHEFGHLIHHLFGMVPVKSLNGIHVAWDFVELPSQILENFCWDRNSLDLFAKHYVTGERIPSDLFDKMIAARNYRAASATVRQLNLSKMDLELHMHLFQDKAMDLEVWIDEVLSDYKMPLKTPSPSILRRFGHLFSSSTGYAAGYYSYKWAEVLDADAFTKFAANGVINSEIGREFREKILSCGNAEDPMTLFENFMGRKPDSDSLLERCGLLKDS
tara:strand:- start:800 stop:2914 length:2115 start_codon:yes stop_codon:yes gene_type:complete